MRHFSLVATAAVVSFFPLAANAASVNLGTSVGVSVGVTSGSQSGGTSASAGTSANVATNVSGSTGSLLGVSAPANISGSAGGSAGANVAANATESDGSAVSTNAVLSAFGSTDGAAKAVASLQSNSVVRVIPVGLMVSADPTAFASASTQNANATATLQAAIKANSDFAAQLAGSGVSVDSVMAGSVNADGSLVLYTKG